MRLSRDARLAAVLGALVVALPARAQDSLTAAPTEVRCRGQTISDIEVITHSPYEGARQRWLRAPLRVLAALHANTRPSVVRRFLLLQLGTPCDERLRSESERLLRTQPYIARAAIRTVEDGAGGVKLVVETTDEVSAVLSAGTSGAKVNGAKIGNRNLAGSGTFGLAEWRRGDIRSTYGLQLVDYQFLGRPYIFDVGVARREIGSPTWHADLAHPFLTDEQRVAWRASAAEEHEVFRFSRGANLDAATLGIEREFFDVGGVVRIGLPGRLSLFGMSVSRESDAAGLPPVIDSTVDYPTLLAPYARRSNARVNALWTVRNIYYRRVERFDALTAAQDVRLGFQFGTLLGRSLTILGTTDDDFLLAADMFVGAGGERTYMRVNLRAEGRQNYDSNRWDGILGSGGLALYRRTADRHTLVTNVDWSGGWRQRIPFQLSLGDDRGGVRGYRRSRLTGARRAVARIEDRWYLGRFLNQADIGLSFFTDAGRLWAGDAPYGVNTGLRFGAGFGVLAAVPPGSKRMWRVDFGFPLSNDDRAKWTVRLSTVNANRVEWREPRDLTRGRERVVPTSVF